MSSNQLASSPNDNRLYTRLIKTLKILQFIGYFIVVVYCFIIFSMFGQSLILTGFSIILFGYLINAVIACIIIYIFTAVLIAIIDLLSRIERNTRPG